MSKKIKRLKVTRFYKGFKDKKLIPRQVDYIQAGDKYQVNPFIEIEIPDFKLLNPKWKGEVIIKFVVEGE